MARADTVKTAGITAPPSDVLDAMWRNQWRDVPAALCYQIENSSDRNLNVAPVFESIGITGAYEATRTMIYADYALGMSRAAYEGNQGCEDFGWNRESPNWAPPGIFVADMDGVIGYYDGTHSLAHSRMVAWVNDGILDVKSILNLDSDDSTFVVTVENPDRKGGFGQGAKVMLSTFVANKTDRINALELYLEKNEGTLNSDQYNKLTSAIAKLKLALEVEGENDTFATVQSKGSDGIYRRTYCYREPFRSNGKELWKLRYIVVELDESKVSETEKNKVIFAVHYPDIPLAESLDGMRENMLETDPYYPDRHSLVRREDNVVGTVEIHKIDCNLPAESRNNPDQRSNGSCKVERIDRSTCQPDLPPLSGKIYFRGTHMIPEDSPGIQLIFDYNITRLDAKAKGRIARSSNSSYVSGPIKEVVADAVSKITKPEDWAKILELAQEVTSAEVMVRDFPELSPKSIKGEKNNSAIYESVKNAFNLKYPSANLKVAKSQAELDAYRELTGDMTPIPIVSSSNLVDFLSEAGITDIKAKSDEIVERKLIIKHGTGQVDIISREKLIHNIRETEEYQAIMAEGNLTIDQLINQLFIKSDKLRFGYSGSSYGIDAPNGKHALIFEFNGHYQIEGLIGQLINLKEGENSSPQVMALLMAAIDSGLEINFESKDYIGNLRTTHLEITPSGNLAIISGESLRTQRGGGVGRIVLGGKVEDLIRCQNFLDETIGKEHPNLIESRTQNEFSTALGIVNQALSYLAPGEKVNAATLENVVQILKTAQDAQAKINASLDKLQGTRRRLAANNGAVNGALQTGFLPGGSRVEGIYREGSMFARSSQSSQTILSRHREAISARREKEESEGFGGNDMKCVHYGKAHYNDVYPVEAYETLQYIPGGMRRSNEYNKLEIAEDPENGPWRYYYPSEGSGYIGRVNEGQTLYDGFFEFRRRLLPTSYEAVLPVDVNKYEITYIQYPVEAGQEPQIPPLLMFDPINRQYSLQFSGEDTPDVLKVLPAGTRIYFRTKSDEEIKSQSTIEKFLIDNHLTYFKSLTKSLIDKEHLDSEARAFVDFLGERQPPLSRREAMTAIYKFWEKRRLYDDEGVVCDTIEELITLGIGVCDEAEPPMTQIPRLLGIPTRARVAYFDQEHQGNLSPPFHLVTEFLNDDGQWEVWRPPGSRVTSQYAEKLARQAADGVVPFVFDAGGLGAGGGQEAKLPNDVEKAVGKLSTNHGDKISDGAVAILNAKNRGEKTDPTKLVEELVREQQPTSDPKFETNTEQIGRVLELMHESNKHIVKLQKKYGVGSKQVEDYRQKVAARLAKMLVNSVKVK